LSFDVLIRGDAVGIKVPAELIARTRGVVIGRSAADSDFVIDSPELSRSHVRLSEKDGILYLEDLGSANGTVLNGLKLKPAQLVALHNGDELELAVSMFAVEFQER
jgi:pSer/pThr/pTyr-binding forkhead associated (FHA) protein